jgi:glyoxylase-like metal-dependent hydrolase (beta-lactamase superfamily II)
MVRSLVPVALALALAAPSAALAQGFNTQPQLPENAARQVTPHVHVIMGFPNVVIVVGAKATLAVDTGLGDRNGALVAREAMRLSPKGNKLYLTTTHFHPEHAGGQGGFPKGTTVIRPRVQQAELEADGQRMLDLFSRSPQFKPFLEGASIGKADVLFDKEHRLDLGGVHARLLLLGGGHTKGDEVIFVEEDSVLIPGDLVENRLSPNVICEGCSPRLWIAALDQIALLKPRQVVPDHGELGDGSLVGKERAFLQELQDRSQALKREGKSAQDAGQIVLAEVKAKYGDWGGIANVPQSVQRAYADQP